MVGTTNQSINQCVMRLGRSLRRRLKTMAIVVLLFIILLAVMRHLNVVCINWDAHSMLKEICSQHEDGAALGNMCDRLCSARDTTVHRCISNHVGKAVVFEAFLDEHMVVMVKSQALRPRLDSNLAQVYSVNGKNGVRKYPDYDQFKHMVISYLVDNYGIKAEITKTDSDQFFSRFWTSKFDSKSAFSITGMENIFDLIQSNEYVLSKLYEEYSVFPSVLGTCGAFYVTERLQPLFSTSSINLEDFVEDVKVVISLLDLLDELEMVFSEPLYLCDVKEEHFGRSQIDDRLKILDADNALLQSIVEREIGSESACEKHEDCSFFDCQGRCDLLQKTCFPAVMNNNLQLLCKNIIQPRLARSKHANEDLKQVLRDCSGSSALDDVFASLPSKANAKIKTQLYKHLKDVTAMADSFHQDKTSL